jgi:hypothetical protein
MNDKLYHITNYKLHINNVLLKLKSLEIIM